MVPPVVLLGRLGTRELEAAVGHGHHRRGRDHHVGRGHDCHAAAAVLVPHARGEGVTGGGQGTGREMARLRTVDL